MTSDYQLYPNFYTNEGILKIADKPKWTISSNDKKPLDMKEYLINKRVYGAKYQDKRSLTTLATILKSFTHTNNVTYFIDALSDNMAVLDIEPTCPNDLKEELLKLPAYYKETSMSGKGIHLLLDLPKNFYDFEVATKKNTLKHKDGYYEILLNHFVTFTRNEIKTPHGEPKYTFEEIYENLAKNAVNLKIKNIELMPEKPKSILKEDLIVSQLEVFKYHKTADDFVKTNDKGTTYKDLSAYEYGCISNLKYRLHNIITRTSFLKNYPYSDNEKAWLLYEAAQKVLPYRPKHDEFRDGLPWLLYLSGKIIAREDNYEKKHKNKN